MKAILKLIRWQNLLIIVLTMSLMRYAVLSSILGRMTTGVYNSPGSMTSMNLQMPLFDFILLILATVFIAAGGYVINDYFDIKTDLINRGEVIVGTRVPRRQAMMLHNILNVLGVAAGFYISWRAGYFWVGIIFLLVSGLLYFYSASYKRQFLIGNVIVAVLTAMVPLMVVIFESSYLFGYYAIYSNRIQHFNLLFWWVGGFAVFAFITTLIREIIKDIEDFEGDAAYGRNTIPVVIGILTTKIVTVCLIAVTIVMLGLIWYFFLNDYITLAYLCILVLLPMLFVVYQVIVSKSRKQLHSASRLMKLIMLAGILYSVVVKIMIMYNLV
ncbi:MAG TPA: geranylgeranylglycerol-phosphate geranylgeranyltransferase [Bacteroidales bacterium]|nr:geranylgeranylglycerol-phosphate geranylgeranyltransferase [Bacteroidales bacterium]